MPLILRMPEVAANATHATLVCWNKAVGERIDAGQSIADVETDKAVLELPVEQTATISELLVAHGTEVAVGDPIAVLLLDDEASQAVGTDDTPMQAETLNDDAISAPTRGCPVTASGDTDFYAGHAPVPSDASSPDTTVASNRRFSSPAARWLAKQNQLDLDSVAGTGPRGRVTKHDVVRHLDQFSGAADVSNVQLGSHTISNPRVVAPSATRRTIAKRLSQSKSEVPHFYLRARCDAQSLWRARKRINDQMQTSLSVNDFVVRAVAVAMTRVPELNVSWRDDGIHHFTQVDLCVAVDTPNGLLTPIVFDAANKTLTFISAEIRELAQQARQGQLAPSQFQGGTFSVSNLGMHGIDSFDAIINPPQAGILAVGKIQDLPVVKDDVIVPGKVMDVVLSVDHRVVDGAVAARWLGIFRDLIEDPITMLV